MNRDLMVHVTPFEVHLAILEDDVLVEYYVERRCDRSVVGNIYKGRVDKVLPGMQSAFVDIGLEKNAFLYVTDILDEFSELAETVEDDGIRQQAPRPAALPSAVLPAASRPEPEEPADLLEEALEAEQEEGLDLEAPPEAAMEEVGEGFPEEAAGGPVEESAVAPAGEGSPASRPSRRRSRRRGRSRSGGQRQGEAAAQPEQSDPSMDIAENMPEPERERADFEPPAPEAPAPTAAESPAAVESAEPPAETEAKTRTRKPAARKRPARRTAKKADAEGEAAEGDNATAEVRLPTDGTAHSQGRNRGRRRRGGGRSFNTAGENEPGNISNLLRQGQEIIAQVVKEPISLKSARITSHISIPGRLAVFLPTFNRIGVSRKIRTDHERRRLRQTVISHMAGRQGGFIIRTAAEGCSENDLIQDVEFLLSTWQDIQERNVSEKAPALLYEEPGLVERILRDRLDETVQTIWIDDESHFAATLSFMERFMPSMLSRVKLFNREQSLFEFFNIISEVQKAMRQKVWLRSGGFIVINHAEALVAIDVNTGRYVGKNSNFEETITRTNLDAAKEIVRQIRLRNLGGIIVMDFIDMQDKLGRKKVMDVLMQELRKDKSPSKVLSFNDFGLVAMTRKRTAGALEKNLSDPCPCCDGNGFVKSVSSTCFDIYASADRMRGTLRGHNIVLRANTEVIRALKGENVQVVEELRILCGQDVILVPDPLMPSQAFELTAD